MFCIINNLALAVSRCLLVRAVAAIAALKRLGVLPMKLVGRGLGRALVGQADIQHGAPARRAVEFSNNAQLGAGSEATESPARVLIL